MLIQPEPLHRLAASILMAAGSEEEEAHQVARHLVLANLRGHDSHGVGMIPTYLEHLRRGLLVPNTPARLVEDQGAILKFDGARGYGQRTAAEATAAALSRTRETGLSLLSLVNAHHLGRIGTYGEQTLAERRVGLFFVNVVDHAPLVAPFRGSDARYGTNPLCMVMPGTDRTEDLLLDMATSKIALGKARIAMNSGLEAPEGSLLDSAGKPTRDPSVMFTQPQGALVALGEHKGYGLGLFCEILAGVLTGGGTSQPGHPRHGGMINHMLAIFIDPARLVAEGWMRKELDALCDYLLASPPQSPEEPVLKPGDPERLAQARRSREGIPIDPTSWEQLLAAGESVGFSRERALALAGPPAGSSPGP